MSEYVAVKTECSLVAEYVDDAGEPTGSPVAVGEVVPTRAVASYVDTCDAGGDVRDFTILLKDDRIVSVRGHGLRMFPPTVPGGGGSYGVIERSRGEEILVALFSIPEVVGIFSGEIRSDRKIA
jgi:hypothetical protein